MTQPAASQPAETRRGGTLSPPRLRITLLKLAIVAVFILTFFLPDLIAPAKAHAAIPTPLAGIDDVINALNPANLAKDALAKAGAEAAGAIQDAFFWMLNQIFGGIQATLSVKLLGWLTTFPDFSGGQVRQLSRTFQTVAGAFLGCVLTLSIIRYWLGSHTAGGGFSAGLEGVIRTAFAALLIGLWPTLFTLAVSGANAVSHVLLNEAARDRLKALFEGLDMATLGISTAGAGAGAISIFVSAGISILAWIIVATASVLLFLALIVMKIIVTAGTVIAFVAMPLALVLWPLPETSWIANTLVKVITVLLAIPIIWILVFAAASAVGADVFFLSNNGKNTNFLGTGLNILLIKPLVACALLYLAVMLPSKLVRMAPMVGGHRMPGSRVAGAATNYATYKGMAMVGGAVGQAVGGTAGIARGLGGSGGPGAGHAFTRSREAARTAGVGTVAAATGGAGAGAAATGAAKTGAAKAGAAAAAGGTPASGIATPTIAGTAAATGSPGVAAAIKPAGNTVAAMPGGTDPANIPIGQFETAAASHTDSRYGGPLIARQSPERNEQVKAEQARINNLTAANRPNPTQVQAAWDKLGESPKAQQAVRAASAGIQPGEPTPAQLVNWSIPSGNPSWGTDAQDATRTIAEASPEVREQVITAGAGYTREPAAEQSPRNESGGGSTPQKNGGPPAGNTGGSGPQTSGPRRSGDTGTRIPNPAAGHPRQPIRQGES